MSGRTTRQILHRRDGRKSIRKVGFLPLPVGEGRGEGISAHVHPHLTLSLKGEGTDRAQILRDIFFCLVTEEQKIGLLRLNIAEKKHGRE
ncbi:hypothetical protein MY016_37440 [Escherichia coli]|nr:hypothetical protein MY016_37440 [Escherichia coli]